MSSELISQELRQGAHIIVSSSGTSIAWVFKEMCFNGYLIFCNRTQRMIYNEAFSDAVPVSSSVIQKSALGSILFTRFVNDCPQRVRNCDEFIFANDAKAFGIATNIFDCIIIQNDLNVGDWPEENKLPISIDKCVCLHYRLHNPNHEYSIHGDLIKNAV